MYNSIVYAKYRRTCYLYSQLRLHHISFLQSILLKSTSMVYKAVIFDIGGVVMRSPFIAIAAYERKLGLPVNYLNCSITGQGSNGAWQRFERGEMDLIPFYEAFGRELSDVKKGNEWYTEYCVRRKMATPVLPTSLEVDGRELFGSMMREAHQYDPYVKEAILRIRASGKFKVIALTNNFAKVNVPKDEMEYLGWDQGAVPQELKSLFDDFCDSSSLGMRKPEKRFYLLACERNNINPAEAIFLDDIGLNLKAARQLGMYTIHVEIGKTLEAVKELEKQVEMALTGQHMYSKL
ncbi:epoxide hydrolase [Panaeolus papilionaceus]|nr:epoxide hydrolase [Panaeolus papilionaceus]